MARYAISDIHGCLRTFKKALRSVDFKKEDTLYLLGDYIDRGLDSKGVIQHIIDLIAQGYNVVPLKGNHEEFLLCALEPCPPYASGPSSVMGMWLSNGGGKCLDSYGVQYPWEIPGDHIKFIHSLKPIHVTDDFVFVHAGLDFTKEAPLRQTSEDFMLWERCNRIICPKIGNRKLITGHTPVTKDRMIYKVTNDDHWMIDRGCVFPQSDYNHLAILNLDTKEFKFIKNIDNIENDRM